MVRARLRRLKSTARNWYVTRQNLGKNSERLNRRLEIGPGEGRIEGFETLNVLGNPNVDYVCDATGRLPFDDESFELVYASHILEHVPWYQAEIVLREWVRIIQPAGRLEIWVPDGLKIARAFVEAEDRGSTEFHSDPWWKFNEQKDPCVWMSGRCFSYGDGRGTPDNPNWHRALFSARHLESLMLSVGLEDVRSLGDKDVRGYDHGWINLGLSGTKP